MMKYKGYLAGKIDVDPENGILSGMVAGLHDVVHFEGRTADELVTAFRESVDDYLAMCAERGEASPFEPLVPNETTIAAVCEARAGNLKSFDSVEALMVDLHTQD